MSVAIQRYTLPVGQESARVELDASVFKGEWWDWKTISFVRNKPTWIEPKMYTHLSSHPSLASSLLLLKSPDWSHTSSLYPVSTLAVNCNLIIDAAARKIYMNVRRCMPGVEGEVYIVRGRTTGSGEAGKVVKIAVDAARKLVGGSKEGEGRRSKFWDGVGVCTWESFGKETGRPTKETLLSLVPSFPITTFLIDDGWQDVSSARSLSSLHEWAGMGAPMNEVVGALKSRGIAEVGVWMTLQGYWISIDPSSALVAEYDCKPYKTASKDQERGGVVVPLRPDEPGKEQWVPSAEKAGQFWLDWFGMMKSWGIGFVKVDNQADYDQITGPGSAHIAQAMWSGMLAAAEQVWGSTDRVIMCMSHNERMLNGPGGLGAERPKGDLVFRNSDDFNLDYDERHPDYVQWNTHMSILTSHLSLIPDFDMFATSPADHWPTYHAFLRALSPGPTLISDTPSTTTDLLLISKLTAITRSGQTRAVKTDTPAMALPGRWFWDNLQGSSDGPAVLAYTHLPAAGGSIIGAWNCRSARGQWWAKDRIDMQDIQEALEVDQLSEEHVLWSTGLAGRSDTYQLVRPGDRVEFKIHLARAECEGVLVSKLWSVGGKRMAVLGMLDKFAPLAKLRVNLENSELVIHSPFNAGVTVLVFDPSAESIKASVDGQEAVSSLERRGEYQLLTVTSGEEGVISGSKSGDYEIRLSA